MKANVEAISGVKRQIRIEVPAEEVARRIEAGFAEARRLAPIRGFRRGKAPMGMIRRLFRESVERDVAEELIRDSLSRAVREHRLRVVSRPEVEGGRVEEGKDLTFTATVEVVPEVEPKDYKGLPAVQQRVEVTEADVEAALESLRSDLAEYHPAEGRGAADGDLVEAAVSAVAPDMEELFAGSISFVLGSGRPFGREFEEKVTGVRPGEERTFEVAFGNEAPDPKLAGKTVSFRVTAHAVRERRLPALDDEFARNFNAVQDLAALRERVRQRLLEERRERARRRLEADVRRGLLERNAFEVPAALVDREVVSLIEDMTGRMAADGIDLKKIHLDFEKMRERFAPAAEKNVRALLLLEAIARKEGIEVSYQEMEAEMRAMAEAAGIPFEEVRASFGEEERLDALRGRLLERKVMDYLVSQAAIREEEAS